MSHHQQPTIDEFPEVYHPYLFFPLLVFYLMPEGPFKTSPMNMRDNKK